MHARSALSVILLALVASACSDTPSAGVAIEHVTVIDAVNGVRPDQTVVFDGDEIVSVEASADETPDVATVVDGSGRYLIPGLWDMHVHLTYDDRLTDAMPGLFLSYGITSVRDTGGLLENLLPVVAEMRADSAMAPRVFFSGPLLDGEFVVYDGDGRPEIGIGNPSVEQARASVAALDEAGVDFIKIYEMVTPEVFEALVDAAGEHDLPIAAHVPLALRASQVAPVVNSMEHLRNVEMDCAVNAEELLAARRQILADHVAGPGAALRSELHNLQRLPAVGDYDEARCREVIASMASTIQVPTLRLNSFSLKPPFDRDDWMSGLDRAPTSVADDWAAETQRRAASPPPPPDTTFAAWSLFLVGQMHEQGVPIGAGTDTPINYSLPGFSLHSELEMLVRAGLSPIEAIRSATVRPAQFFGLENQMGTIEAGRAADLVLLSADPLQDISNTRRIEAVITRGRYLDAAALASLTRQ